MTLVSYNYSFSYRYILKLLFPLSPFCLSLFLLPYCIIFCVPFSTIYSTCGSTVLYIYQRTNYLEASLIIPPHSVPTSAPSGHGQRLQKVLSLIEASTISQKKKNSGNIPTCAQDSSSSAIQMYSVTSPVSSLTC